MDNDVPGQNETVPISVQAAVAHECEYRAREAREAVRDWHAMSAPVKRAILEDAAVTLERAYGVLQPEQSLGATAVNSLNSLQPSRTAPE